MDTERHLIRADITVGNYGDVDTLVTLSTKLLFQRNPKGKPSEALAWIQTE